MKKSRYNTTEIRDFIIQHFDDEELGQLCDDHFEEVSDRLTAAMNKRKKAHYLVQWLGRRGEGRLGKLVELLKVKRAGPFAEWDARLKSPGDPSALLEQKSAGDTPRFGNFTKPRTQLFPRRGAGAGEHSLAEISGEVKRRLIVVLLAAMMVVSASAIGWRLYSQGWIGSQAEPPIVVRQGVDEPLPEGGSEDVVRLKGVVSALSSKMNEQEAEISEIRAEFESARRTDNSKTHELQIQLERALELQRVVAAELQANKTLLEQTQQQSQQMTDLEKEEELKKPDPGPRPGRGDDPAIPFSLEADGRLLGTSWENPGGNASFGGFVRLKTKQCRHTGLLHGCDPRRWHPSLGQTRQER